MKTKKSLSGEQPVEVIQNNHSGDHKTEVRIFARNIHESWCAEPECPFYGQHTVQGVCHTTTTTTGSSDWSYIEAANQQGETHLASIKRQYKGKKLLQRLEGEVVAGWANQCFILDELVSLRREVSLLKLKSKKNS